MADLRLLKRWFVRGIASVLLAGCTLGPIWAREVRGRVVDRETQKPVAGAEVFVGKERFIPNVFDAERIPDHYRWAATDEDGRFVIPGRLQIRPAIGCTPFQFDVVLYHQDYGAHQVVWGGNGYPESPINETQSFDLTIWRRDSYTLGRRECSSWMDEPACSHLFDLMQGRGNQ